MNEGEEVARMTKSKQFALRMRPAVYAAGERAAADGNPISSRR